MGLKPGHGPYPKGTQVGRIGKTEEEYRANCAKGGRKAAAVVRRKRAMRESMELVLQCDPSKFNSKRIDDLVEYMRENGMPEEYCTTESAICAKMARAALGGDVGAAIFCRDTSGQAPASKVAVGGVNDLAEMEGCDMSKLSKEELQKLMQEADEAKK